MKIQFLFKKFKNDKYTKLYFKYSDASLKILEKFKEWKNIFDQIGCTQSTQR